MWFAILIISKLTEKYGICPDFSLTNEIISVSIAMSPLILRNLIDIYRAHMKAYSLKIVNWDTKLSSDVIIMHDKTAEG